MQPTVLLTGNRLVAVLATALLKDSVFRTLDDCVSAACPSIFIFRPICGEIREFSDTSIVMLTAKSDTDDVVRGLEAGADDYIPKPFKPAELLARVKARLRPGSRATSTELMVGDVTVDITGHRVLRGQEEIALTPLEFELLATLARSPEQVFTRDMLLRQVWGYHNAADTRLVNVHVQRLRSKVERDPENPQIIVTVRGVGYRAGHEHR